MDKDMDACGPDWGKGTGAQLALWMARASKGEGAPEHPVEVMWADRKLGLLGFVFPMLCALRDAGYVKLDLGVAFKALELEGVQRLERLEWVGDDCRDAARRYLEALPGHEAGVAACEQSESAQEAHDFLRFGIELPIRKALGLGFGDSKPISWERIPESRLEMAAIEEAKVLADSLARSSKKARRRL